MTRFLKHKQANEVSKLTIGATRWDIFGCGANVKTKTVKNISNNISNNITDNKIKGKLCQ